MRIHYFYTHKIFTLNAVREGGFFTLTQPKTLHWNRRAFFTPISSGSYRKRRQYLAMLVLMISLILLAKASWISAKAVVAQILIAHAWEHTLDSGNNTKPWQWADTWPVAALTPPNGDTLYVLASTSGQALAFGPGLLSASAAPGAQGNTVIAGHRDTHFKFMEHLQVGDKINLQSKAGNTYTYQVDSIEIVDSRLQQILLQQQTAELTLITCYPFNALTAGGPLRYVIHARLL